MKKLFIITIAAMALLSSCAKTDKCKCTIKTDKLTLDDQILTRPEDKTCAQIKVDDVSLGGGLININLSDVATIKCVNHYDE